MSAVGHHRAARPPLDACARGLRGAGRSRAPRARRVAVALVLLPLVFLVVQALQSGLGRGPSSCCFRHTVAVLLWNTVRLAVACTLLCAVLGVGGGVVRGAHRRCPARRLWAVLLVLPLGIPDFVVGFGWVSIDPGAARLPGGRA